MKLVDMRVLGTRAFGVTVRVRSRAKREIPTKYSHAQSKDGG